MWLVSASAAVVLLLSTALGFFLLRRTARYPPGPKGWPIFGNLHLLPRERSWEYAFDAAKKHGTLPARHTII